MCTVPLDPLSAAITSAVLPCSLRAVLFAPVRIYSSPPLHHARLPVAPYSDRQRSSILVCQVYRRTPPDEGPEHIDMIAPDDNK